MKRCRYKRTWKEWLVTVSGGCGLCMGLGWLFYRHVAGMFLLLLLPVWVRLDGVRRERKYQEEMAVQFKDVLQSMVSAMQAGYSLEHSIPYAAEELVRLYQKETPMVRALRELSTRIGMSETTEQAFAWLAESTDVDDIREFVQVLVTTKRTGGNLIKVMLHTAEQVSMRQEVEREIRTLVAGKRLEANLMNLLPPAILLYLWISMPDLVAPLYHNLRGVLLMTVILLGYGGSCLWTGKILQVKM